MALAHNIEENPRKFLPHRSVLLVSDSAEKAAKLSPELHAKGYNTVTSIFNGDHLQGIPRQAPDAIILCVSSNNLRIPAITKALRDRYSGKNLPLIGVFEAYAELPNSDFDSVLFEPVHPNQIVHRIAAMIRLTIMQTEMTMRMETLKQDFDIDYRLNPDSFQDTLKVLFIGKATPEFMVIINALEQKDVEVIAAFTSFTAFDFLHETTFDAVVINSLNGMEPGLTISQTMRRNAALYHTPALLLGKKGMVQDNVAYEHGVSDILYSEASEKDIQDRILELARFHRLHRQVKAEFDNLGQAECMDESGAYSNLFFAKHLNRLVDAYSKQDLPVSILTCQARFDGEVPAESEIKSAALNQLGSMIKNMVRVYDVTARLSDNIFVIAFPGQPASSLVPVLTRLSGLSKSSEFGALGKSFKFSLALDLAELGHGVTGESWLAQQLVNY